MKDHPHQLNNTLFNILLNLLQIFIKMKKSAHENPNPGQQPN